MGPKPKVSKGNDDEEMVISYFKKNARPFSPQQIESAFPMLGKTKTVKLLKFLADNGRIIQKESGKAFIYWYDQDNEQDNPVDEYGQPLVQQVSIDDLNRSNATLKSQLDELEQQLKSIQSSTKELAGQLTNSEIASKIDTLEKSNAQHETKLAAYKKKNVVASAGEKKKLEAKHDKARREWVARRKMFKEVLDTILERSSKKKKDLQEEIGWEADEDLNITIIPDRTKKDNSSTSSSSSAPEYKRHKKAYS